MRRFGHDERGAVAAEHVAAILIVAALIAAVWSVALPQRVEEVAEVASDCLFQTDPEPCEVPSQAQNQTARPEAEPTVAPGGEPQLPDPQIVDGAVEQIDELLDGGWPRGVTSGDLEEVIELLAGLPDDELDAVFDQLTAEQRQTLLDEIFGHNRLAWWRNLSEDEQARFANDVLARLSPEQLARLDREQLVDEVLPLLDADNLGRTLDAVDLDGIGRVAVDDAESGESRAGGEPPTGNEELDAVQEAAADFWEYLYRSFGRDSLDGEGGPMLGTINDPDTPNARWSRGDEQTYYREGWAVESIVIHEFAHGLVYYMTGGLDTSNVETAALNEALADMFAMNITGEGIIGGELEHRNDPIRIPEEPRRHPDNHPDHATGFIEDEGGHHNSTILSHAYHLMLDDVGQDVAQQTLYASLEHLGSDAGFEDLRSAMLEAAGDLYGADSDEWRGIEAAFRDVGLDGSWDPDDPNPAGDDGDRPGPT